MAVTIRLSRQGAKKNPQYLIIAVDPMKKRDGAYLEKLGHYYPKAKTAKEKIQINMDKFNAWTLKGAQVSQTVGQLVKTLAK
ncbi:MAG: 30S ribosomal protein S16 [Bdellovibrionales bacterium GWB1_52_6]|nr:MAG: 30S ribosomal protein S16 [Bdellovibrionales bacterium GWB1_52_6]OFZ03705.1 MAG: 30S ribosomal protein S16 [Bdellovibrionales bacterium GWA1_52_35]HCM38783.1 30S ribosomal protein S16 [Bdellovibrionales bacterium]